MLRLELGAALVAGVPAGFVFGDGAAGPYAGVEGEPFGVVVGGAAFGAARSQVLWGVVLIVVGLIVGPGGVSLLS